MPRAFANWCWLPAVSPGASVEIALRAAVPTDSQHWLQNQAAPTSPSHAAIAASAMADSFGWSAPSRAWIAIPWFTEL
jgi:hypothetical protein